MGVVATKEGNCTHPCIKIPAEAFPEVGVLPSSTYVPGAELAALANNATTRCSVADLDEQPKAYPLKPPGIFSNILGDASTKLADMSKGWEEPPQEATHESLKAAQETEKSVIREIQVLPMDRVTGQPLRVRWPVDGKKLKSRDQQIVSPVFEMYPGCLFRLMLKPKVFGSKKGQASFQKARGVGSVELKLVECELKAPALRLNISVGDAFACGPITYDFGESSVAGFNDTKDYCNFGAAVEQSTNTFLIALEASPAHGEMELSYDR